MFESKNSSRWFFIPVYNESRAIGIILRNIRTIRRHSPAARIFISDNCSTDNTFAQLLHIQTQYPREVIVTQQERNVGFARNCSELQQLPNGSLITLLGANDYLHPRGLKHLEHCIRRYPNAALLICNWSYYTNSCSPLGSRIYTGDVTTTFATTSLAHYLEQHVYPPNGIMQYTGTKEVFRKFGKYIDELSNPQLGVFFESFPQLVVACAGPPLALVKHVEPTGWRSSKESIIHTHMLLMVEVRQLLQAARREARLSESAYRSCLLAYLKAPVDLLASNWGEWTISRKERQEFIEKAVLQLFNTTEENWSLRLIFTAYLIKQRFLGYIQQLRFVLTKDWIKCSPDIDTPVDPPPRIYEWFSCELRLLMKIFATFHKRS